ncbi:MAG: hypothetical protein EA381_20660 [Planctomycetaceae bacterium]|nr:MAG: hypothetical protein EA381_20660 [Planctomycetaceae bacterium]
MILLVVLGMLTFFSILVATYLVFANQSRQSASVMASRQYRAPDVRKMMDSALMKLIRGTADPTDPFFGEDLLSDYYGRFDARDFQVVGPITYVGRRFARVRVAIIPAPGAPPLPAGHDDFFTGRVITFIGEGSPLNNQSVRVFRSRYTVGNSNPHSFYFELPEKLYSGSLLSDGLPPGPLPDAQFPWAGLRIHMNGEPRNSPGLGFGHAAGTLPASERNIDWHSTPQRGDFLPGLTISHPNPPPANPNARIPAFPMALQPNHLVGGGTATTKLHLDNSGVILPQGDFDEAYDAADYNNWFLSYRDSEGKIIPSFHRPSVINYIVSRPEFSAALLRNSSLNVNEPPGRGSAMVTLARATYRPLPFAPQVVKLNASLPALAEHNTGFTGSNPNYALRTPIDFSNIANNEAAIRFRVDQLIRALVGSPEDWNPWDVDNDGDGIPDSIWMDIGLPVITSREGKLLKPLIAPMIEDLSARLNVNAHGNYELPDSPTVGGATGKALWASTRQPFSEVNPTNHRLFRGLGYGPAEIVIPRVTGLERARHQYGNRADVALPPVGIADRDSLDFLRTGWRPPLHGAVSGYGYSTDPFGRAAVGLGRGGQLVVANSGLPAIAGGGNEATNTPYESDPSGRLAGDRPFTFHELEPLLRSNSFDLELLPNRLYGRLQTLIQADPDFARVLTTLSKSDDSLALPIENSGNQPAFLQMIRSIRSWVPPGTTMTPAQVQQVLPPEFRQGRKLDVNRAFGNGVDDNNNQVIDEPGEGESEAFRPALFATDAVPADYQGVAPDYGFGTGLNGRQLLARHLYVLMMALVEDVEFPGLDPAIPMDPSEQALYRARRIAQWAVNVVDYRDPDSISTRFVYDPNPFDGWDVRYEDFNFVTNQPFTETIGNPPAMPSPEVWGVEQPELVFSESLALHDVKVRDTNRDPSGRDKGEALNPDPHTDQVRLPQGSLFLELYCPRDPVDLTVDGSGNPQVQDQRSKQGFPRELYRFPNESNPGNASTLALDLSLTAPAVDGDVRHRVPVWRIAFSAPHPDPATVALADPSVPPLSDPERDPWRLRQERPDTASFEPGNPDELILGDPILLDRFIWFMPFDDFDDVVAMASQVPDMMPEQIFFTPPNFATNANRRLFPGQFLTLAPRPVTNLGSQAFAAGSPPDRPTHHRFAVDNAQGLVHFDHDNRRLTPTLGMAHPAPFAPAKPLVIGTFPPVGANWSRALVDNRVGLNVSEPMPRGGNYYPLPTLRYSENNADYPLEDAYVDLSLADNTALDLPLDPTRGRVPPDSTNPDEPFLGSLPSYCTAYLQRLADPTRPYHVVANPYRTVDAMPIDLTVFSGEEREQTVNERDSDYFRRSRQRNGVANGPRPVDRVRRDALFSYETSEPEAVSLNTAAPAYFTLNGSPHLYSSLSFLNTVFPLPGAGGGTPVNPVHADPEMNGFSPSIGMSGPMAQTVSGFDRNLPQVPYGRHPWLNRPFASHLELMMVPASSQGRMFQEFSLPPEAANPLVYSEPNAAPGDIQTVMRFYGPFRHLLNFFHGDSQDTTANPYLRADFARIFDFVHTLPRFRGEVEMISPARLAGIEPTTQTWLRQIYSPPFNYRYDNQRLGRINLNTLAEFPAWQGLMQGHMNNGEFTNPNDNALLSFQNFLRNRRGFDVTGGAPQGLVGGGGNINYDPTRFDSRFPTEFAGVYRQHADAGLAPRVSGPSNPPESLRRRGVDANFLRHRETMTTGANPPSELSMYVRDLAQAPLPNPADHTRDRQRDAFIRNQTAMRMPNLAGDNSQTYVVWLTLGFFEVDENIRFSVPPPSLGREYNEDIGQNVRYQAMFIIDRSRPVGFVPGQDLNARDVVVFEKHFQ